MMNEQTQKHNIAVVAAALDLMNSPGMTVDRLRTLREDFISTGGATDEVDQAYYDAILAAIEMMTRPMFQ